MNSWKNKTLLLLEDTPLERVHYIKICESLGFSVRAYSHPIQVDGDAISQSPHFVMCDIFFKGNDGKSETKGLDFIRRLKQESPTATILAMSSNPHITLYTECSSAGAHHFIKKPIQTKEELELALTIALKNRAQNVDQVLIDIKQSDWLQKYPDGYVLSVSERKVIAVAAKNPNLPLVLIGETGTGKEAVVNAMLQIRKKNELFPIPIIIVNCAAIPKDLAESMLFGHKKGAFSGAVENSLGYIGAADQGVLFLDEIHCLDLSLQQKLLRVLQDGQYTRLGEIKSHSSQFQVVAASTQDLDSLVDQGQFLLDLRSRLTGLEIHLKPLRERYEDLFDLIGLHLAKLGVAFELVNLNNLVKKCKNYYWQGNIRQLFLSLNVMLANSKGQEMPPSADFLPEYKSMHPPSHFQIQENVFENKRNIRDITETNWISKGMTLKEIIESVEKNVLFQSLKMHNGNASKVCRDLNIPRSTFDNKRKKYLINY